MIILQGENIAKSRTELINNIRAAKNKKEIIRLDGGKINLTDLIQALESPSFFANQKLIVIENLISRKDKEGKKIIEHLEKQTQEEIIWWEPKLFTPSLQKKLKEAKILTFKISPIIFKFLESLKPGNTLQSLKLLKECQKQDSAEIIFYMLARQARLLIQAQDKNAPGLLNGPPWLKNKFISQAKKFSSKDLLNFHQQLLVIDYQIKSGQSLMPLDWHLDLLISGI